MKSGFRSVSRSTEEKNMPADVAGGFLQRYAVTIGTTITVLGFLAAWRAVFATENA
jgi:primosomal replication protein N